MVPLRRISLLLCVVALAALPASAQAVLPGINGRILFTSGRDTGNNFTGIFFRTITSDTGAGEVLPAIAPVGMEQLRHPSWAPDRKKVVYARGTPFTGPYEIHIGSLTEVADDTINGTAGGTVSSDRPAWSPDGKKIAWEQGATSGNKQTDIIVYDVATHTKVNITNTTGDSETKPAWSPDSQTLYFAHGDPTSGHQNIEREPAGGGTPVEITGTVFTTGFDELQPSISPDGTKICYTLYGSGGQTSADVVVGSLSSPENVQILSSDDPSGSGHQGDYNCTWSPDGRFIAYTRGFSTGALVMEHSDNSDLAPITLADDPTKFDGNPDWAPDGPPRCKDETVQAIQGKTRKIPLPCHDTGPKYEQTEVDEAIANDSSPAHGTLGTVRQDHPSTVPYTAKASYTGPDTFQFVGLGINGGSDRGTATILVLKKGACANMKTGSAKRNHLNGTIAGDRLLGLGGNDVLQGFGGTDCLFGGAGKDVLKGGTGGDRLFGNDGNDTLRGGDGKDKLVGGKGKDTFRAGAGKDRVLAADGHEESVDCGSGSDTVVADHKDKLHHCEHVTRK